MRFIKGNGRLGLIKKKIKNIDMNRNINVIFIFSFLTSFRASGREENFVTATESPTGRL